MVATMALATVLAGCGGGGSAKPVTAPTTVAAVPPSSGPDGDTFCSLIKEYSNRLGNLSQASSTPDQIRQLAQDVHSAIQSALGVAPGDIKSDATVVAGAADDYLAALKDAGYDLAKVPPDALQRFQAPDVSTSAARLQVYSQDVCHTRS